MIKPISNSIIRISPIKVPRRSNVAFAGGPEKNNAQDKNRASVSVQQPKIGPQQAATDRLREILKDPNSRDYIYDNTDY